MWIQHKQQSIGYGMGPDGSNRIHIKALHFLNDPGDPYLVQSVEEQALFLCKRGDILKRYDASTSRLGIGIRKNSFKTPPGMHRVKEKIGAGAALGRVFKGRVDTGITFSEIETDENLITTRILRLEGLEEGINRGNGVDSYERFIYIHGTNREELVGTPFSQGCIVLGNEDVVDLFELVETGTIVYIDPPPMLINGSRCKNIHFTGIFGTGMSALAQYLRFQGIEVSGSDRLHNSKDTASIKQVLEGLRCAIFDQDGVGVGDYTDGVCVSTAIEETNPDIAEANIRGIPVFHRSELLAHIIASNNTVAVAGTSGKSTVTAMIFEFLTACGRSPSTISGAPLLMLERQGLIGNAYSGGSDLLVVEADESDGTLVRYAPAVSVILNISKDHKEIDELKGLFTAFAEQSGWVVVNGDDPLLADLCVDERFGRNNSSSWHIDGEELLSESVKLLHNGVEYHLPLPGAHNLENLAAALSVCEHLRCDGPALQGSVQNFGGVARRFSITKTASGVVVIDDFAHNPAKIAAAVNASRGLCERLIAIYQPHGFGPTRFLRDEYVDVFRTVLRGGDSLYLLPIYYAGGTATKDITSQDIIDGLAPSLFYTQAVADRDELLKRLEVHGQRGDALLVMGARDPSLPALVRDIVKLFGGDLNIIK